MESIALHFVYNQSPPNLVAMYLSYPQHWQSPFVHFWCVHRGCRDSILHRRTATTDWIWWRQQSLWYSHKNQPIVGILCPSSPLYLFLFICAQISGDPIWTKAWVRFRFFPGPYSHYRHEILRLVWFFSPIQRKYVERCLEDEDRPARDCWTRKLV